MTDEQSSESRNHASMRKNQSTLPRGESAMASAPTPDTGAISTLDEGVSTVQRGIRAARGRHAGVTLRQPLRLAIRERFDGAN